MADKSWKVWERQVAADLGGERTGPMGKDLPDVSGVPVIAPECKYQKRLALNEADFQQARDNATKIGKLPVLFLKERGGKRKRVVMDYDDYLTLFAYVSGGPRSTNCSSKETTLSHG